MMRRCVGPQLAPTPRVLRGAACAAHACSLSNGCTRCSSVCRRLPSSPRLPPPSSHTDTPAPLTTSFSPSSPRPRRSFCSEQDDPLLWASTYQAGPALQALQAAAASGAAAAQHLLSRYCPRGLPGRGPAAASGDPRKAAVRGYKAQSARVLEHVDRLLAGCEARRQSLVVEGVHLSLRWGAAGGKVGEGQRLRSHRWRPHRWRRLCRQLLPAWLGAAPAPQHGGAHDAAPPQRAALPGAHQVGGGGGPRSEWAAVGANGMLGQRHLWARLCVPRPELV